MSKLPLSWNPDTGVASWWHQDGEGWAVETCQHAAPILDLNREAANHCDPYNAARDTRMVARIPFIVIAKWRNELGVDYWNPDHQDAVDRLLDDPDWRWLRTDTGNRGAVQMSGGGVLFDAPASDAGAGLVI